MNFVLISQKKYNIYHCFSQEQIATNGRSEEHTSELQSP